MRAMIDRARAFAWIVSFVIIAWSASTSLAQQVIDSDGDGIPDSADACPKQAGIASDQPRKHGCSPTADSDGDGILDSNDACPDAPEDKDGFRDEDGCPDPDNDGDRVLDGQDKCPAEPETRNGYQDQDGCPDALPRVLQGRTTPHKDFPDWVPPATPNKPIADPPKPVLRPTPPAIIASTTPARPAGQPSPPSGYRCGARGTLVLNQGCRCPAGRSERRDADDVAMCVTGPATATAPAPARPPTAPARPLLEPVSQPGNLLITTKGTITAGASWATVSIDGRPFGQTPVVTKIAPGKHKIVYFRGGTSQTRAMGITVQAGETTRVILELE